MRRVITAISFMLLGSAAFIFILAILVPLLRETSTPAGKGETDAHESSVAVEKTIQGLERENTQSPAVNNEIPPSITPSQPEIAQSQLNGVVTSAQPSDASGVASPVAPNEPAIERNQGESSPIQSLQTSPQAAIPQSNEKSAETVEPIGPNESSSAQNEPMSLLVLGEGFFPPGEVTPKASMLKVIDKIIPMIKERSQDNVVVEGHADNWLPGGVTPSQADKWNKVLSFLRANAVAEVLKQKGVASDRIVVRGLGDAVPIASNRTRAGRAKNRRVEIKLSPKK